MQQQVQFDRDLYHFLQMAVEIWPSFKAGVKHLSEVGYPSNDSFLPQRSYNTMGQSQFTKIIIDDLFDFIMTHDIKPNDLYDYLSDILSLLMIEEDLIGGSSNPCSIQYMAQFTYLVIEDLTNGKRDKIDHFELNVYKPVKQFKQNLVQDQQNEDSSSDQDSMEQNQIQDENEEQNLTSNAIMNKSEEEMQKQKQLQDDGWTIVRKK